MKKQSKYNVKKSKKMTKLFLRNTLTDLDILGIIDKLTRSAAQKQRVNIENNIVQKFCMYNTFII